MFDILIGCEKSQRVCMAFRELGFNAYSCDLQKCSGDHPEWHLQMDVFPAIKLKNWKLGIFFPDCTYLTCSAEWAYKEGPYHQKLQPHILTGKKRQETRIKATQFVINLWGCHIKYIAIENPVGILGTKWKKPSQIIQPYEYGDDASKKTCLWLKNLPLLYPTKYISPRIINNKKRWGNQTDNGQNKLPPSKDRAEIRGKTYLGIAKAMADQWGNYLLREKTIFDL